MLKRLAQYLWQELGAAQVHASAAGETQKQREYVRGRIAAYQDVLRKLEEMEQEGQYAKTV